MWPLLAEAKASADPAAKDATAKDPGEAAAAPDSAAAAEEQKTA